MSVSKKPLGEVGFEDEVVVEVGETTDTVKTVNGISPTDGAVTLTGENINVDSTPNTTVAKSLSKITHYIGLLDETVGKKADDSAVVKTVDGVSPVDGAVTVTADEIGAGIEYHGVSVSQVLVRLDQRTVKDDEPTEGSVNLVTSGAVYAALENKQDNLEFDDTPMEGSTNPVTSAGIRKAIKDVLSAALVFKGTVATKGELDALTDMTNGDVYIVTGTGIVYAYVEADKAWKELSNTVIDTSKFVKTVNEVTPDMEGNVSVDTLRGENEHQVRLIGSLDGETLLEFQNAADYHLNLVVNLKDPSVDLNDRVEYLVTRVNNLQPDDFSSNITLRASDIAMSADNSDSIPDALDKKQDKLTAGYGIKIDSANEVSVTPLDLKTFSPTPPTETSNQGIMLGYEGTLANVLGTDDPYVTIKTIGFIRRFTENEAAENKTVYCRLLVHDGTAWQVAMQSTNSVYLKSVALGAKYEPFKMELVDDQYDMLPVTKVVRVVFVTDTSASATTMEPVGARTTSEYTGALATSSSVSSTFAPVMDIVYAVGLVTLSSVETLIDEKTTDCVKKTLTEEYDLTTLEGIQAALAAVIPVLGGTVKTA